MDGVSDEWDVSFEELRDGEGSNGFRAGVYRREFDETYGIMRAVVGHENIKKLKWKIHDEDGD